VTKAQPKSGYTLLNVTHRQAFSLKCVQLSRSSYFRNGQEISPNKSRHNEDLSICTAWYLCR